MDTIKKVFKPGGLDDPVKYGTPEPKNVHAEGGSHDHKDVLAQAEGVDPVQNAKPTTESRGVLSDTQSSMSIKTGNLGPYASHADDGSTASEPPAYSSGSGMAGSSAAAPGLPEKSSARDPFSDATGGRAQPRDDISAATYTDRSFPLSGGVHGQTSDAQRYGTDEAMRQDPSTGINQESHIGRDAALGGAGAAGAGMLASEHGTSGSTQPMSATSGYAEPPSSITGGTAPQTTGVDPDVSGSRVPGDAFGFHKDNEQPVEGYVHHTRGPHATDIANQLDPHVPGEFPTESGEDPHAGHLGRDAGIGAAGLGAAGLGAAGYEASKRDEPSVTSAAGPSASSQGLPIMTTTNTMQSGPSASQRDVPTSEPHHYGRDAAVAGGVGAAGVGAYELAKDREPVTQTQPPVEQTQALGQPQHSYGRDTAVAGGAGAAGLGAHEMAKEREPLAPTSQAQPPLQQTQPLEEPQHHYGRDAAVAGGAGAVGVGAYELAKDTEPLGQTSQNQPPMGQTQPLEQPQHQYGRDAAVAGGAGAAGVGAHEVAENRRDAAPTSATTASTSSTTAPHDSSTAAKASQPSTHLTADIIYGEHPKSDPFYAEERKHESEPQFGKDAAAVAEERKHDSEPQFGKDAAAVGGAGALGAGAYEAEKHHEHDEHDKHDKEHSKGEKEPSALGAWAKAEFGIGSLNNKGIPAVQKDKDGNDIPEASASGAHDQHYGRDAAVAGGASAAGLGAYEATKDRRDENTAPASAAAGHHGHHEHNKLHKKNDPRGMDPKHERDLQQAREEEAAHGGDHGKKKEGLLHKILHPGQHKHDDPAQQYASAGTQEPRGRDTGAVDDGRVIEPHTGLPMDMSKGSGAGGTDGAQQIPGYHETDPTTGQPKADWDNIKKANTPY